MAAIGTVRQQLDGLDVLRQILELAKNPDSIISAHELAKKEFSLTEKERSEAEEARAYLSQYKAVRESAEAKENEITTAQESHARDVESFLKEKADFLADVDFQRKEILDKKSEILAAEMANNSRSKLLDAANADAEKKYREMASDIALDASKNEANRASNEIEAARLASLAANLRASAVKMKEVTAEIA